VGLIHAGLSAASIAKAKERHEENEPSIQERTTRKMPGKSSAFGKYYEPSKKEGLRNVRKKKGTRNEL
jgi:hypothetical protein